MYWDVGAIVAVNPCDVIVGSSNSTELPPPQAAIINTLLSVIKVFILLT